ncbi:c-type cytochrome [Chelatococcus asaccharovorans]|uniref:c-type cytochrome n=1 Tax=Chelatococcus asaccharovorans TaxID=28210 RepID=UPI00224C794E|nr:c-type cytochrome [Chelatococcus asaccharovorans]CAH1660751.1 Cytochrome bd-I ubiquinol oxidase subunit 1 apoprotein [Chelatococcus asaccharovorans]CAH1683687.1 Cytochrome bd-I ubiquinol oxidase subunit 1 apoprotein [Chelatococcus asaccharovorans]
MDFPVFHLDFFGNRWLIATIAILHVLVNHGLAVGMMPLVAAMEWYGQKKQDPRWDRLAYKILFFCFLITTTIGALTGVGIWLSVSLVNPYSIASLIRVFFWAWFTEWLVFITEVCLILAYTLTWKKWSNQGPEKKKQHIRLGFALAFFSWVTMAIIVAILGFMMDPGNWLTDHSFWTGVLNPLYIPQLAFRTPLAAAMAGIVALFLILFFTKRQDGFRHEALRAVALWTLAFAPFVLAAGWWYYTSVPDAMKDNLGVSLATLAFADWQTKFLQIAVVTVVTILLVVQFAISRPNLLPKVALVVPFFAILWMTGHFERVREFIRKPYVIGQYMYANGMRVDDYALLQRDGVLTYATYSNPLTEAEKAGLPERLSEPERTARLETIQKGKDVFMDTCSRCHTGHGVNSITSHLQRMFGDKPWTPELTAGYIEGMHYAQPYMPPFPGSKAELQLLGAYLEHLQHNKAPIPGAQSAGVIVHGENAGRIATKTNQTEAAAR